jgi:hypothetical protein
MREKAYRLCNFGGPSGIVVALAERIGQADREACDAPLMPRAGPPGAGRMRRKRCRPVSARDVTRQRTRPPDAPSFSFA